MAMMDTNAWIGVIVAAIVSFVIGGIWYGPAFGKMWMAALGKTDADKEAMRKQAPKGFLAGLIGSFISSWVLAIVVTYARGGTFYALPSGIVGGLVVGFLVWFGFLMTTTVSGAIFEGRSGKLLGINIGYSFIAYLLMGAIIGYFIP